MCKKIMVFHFQCESCCFQARSTKGVVNKKTTPFHYLDTFCIHYLPDSYCFCIIFFRWKDTFTGKSSQSGIMYWKWLFHSAYLLIKFDYVLKALWANKAITLPSASSCTLGDEMHPYSILLFTYSPFLFCWTVLSFIACQRSNNKTFALAVF